MPTKTVSDRTSAPAVIVSTAIPSLMASIDSVVTCCPAAIVDAVAVATAGLLLVTLTGVIAPAGADRIVTTVVTSWVAVVRI